MPLDATIIEPVSGNVDPELSACLTIDEHSLIFGHPEMSPEQFPLLRRMSDYYSDAHYVTKELEALIAELERAAILFEPYSNVRRFLGLFHTMCAIAFLRQKSIALHAD